MSSHWMPAQPGDKLADIDTPALVLDLDRFDANLERMMAAAAAAGVRVRPHAKSHKSLQIAHRQVAAGAVGVCCQKIGEAEVFLGGGVRDVLITNEIVGVRKLRRLAQLAKVFSGARLGVCVDDFSVVRQLSLVCAEEDAGLDVYVEVDVGQNRAGVATPEEAVELAREVMRHPRLTLMGLQAYAGSAQHRRGVPERRDAARRAAAKAAAARSQLRESGLACEIVTGGGTGTFIYDANGDVYDEIQPGSFIFMDADYARNQADTDAPQFEHSLFILATVMSLRGDRATLDAGLKAFSTDSGPARPTFTGWHIHAVSDEHSMLTRIDESGPAIRLGAKALLIPGHCDPTVNLHDWIVAVRKGKVEDVWRIDARGMVF
ncbi:MAG: DSD1 family PLP-dependent enzyme [Burkholderiales bacterium]|nr:DSD1 family PLP-dependent enzyme [Burkholderiales bacterium]